MGPTLVLEVAPGFASPHLEGDLVVPPALGRIRRQHLDLPAHALGVAGVHVGQILGEQVGFLAAFGTPDLDDDVLAVVGIARQQQEPELLLDPGHLGLGCVHLGPGVLPLLAPRLGVHVPRRLEVGGGGLEVAVGADHRFQLLVPAGGVLQRLLVGDDAGIGEAGQHLLILRLELSQALQHEVRLRSGEPQTAARQDRAFAWPCLAPGRRP